MPVLVRHSWHNGACETESRRVGGEHEVSSTNDKEFFNDPRKAIGPV
jgi:hypothetical protein